MCALFLQEITKRVEKTPLTGTILWSGTCGDELLGAKMTISQPRKAKSKHKEVAVLSRLLFCADSQHHWKDIFVKWVHSEHRHLNTWVNAWWDSCQRGQLRSRDLGCSSSCCSTRRKTWLLDAGCLNDIQSERAIIDRAMGGLVKTYPYTHTYIAAIHF